MFDLMSAAREALLRALTDRVPVDVALVFNAVPLKQDPPFIYVGAIDSENTGTKSAQAERLTVAIYAVYRGTDPFDLLAMMHAARDALDRRPIAAEGAEFQPPRFHKAIQSEPWEQDGVTYSGIVTFIIDAEPA